MGAKNRRCSNSDGNICFFIGSMPFLGGLIDLRVDEHEPTHAKDCAICEWDDNTISDEKAGCDRSERGAKPERRVA